MAERSETTHEEQGAKHGKKVRTGSREALADAEARLTRVELAIADGEDKFEEVNQRIEELDKGKEELREAMQGALNLTLDKCLGQVKTLEETFKAEIVALKEELVRVTDELTLCKKVIAQGGHVEVTPTPSKLDIPKPKFYKGARNAKELDNFLWGVEQYFKALGITEDASKIDTTTLYLDDTARMWWRRRQGDVEKGTCTINTWAEFKKELKLQFYPVNAEEEARAKLRRLQHKGTIKDYVKDFTEVLLEIPDYPDKEAFFAFSNGLQNWVKMEIQRWGAQDLATAISVAESLIEFKKSDKPKIKDKGGKGNSGGEGNQSKAGSHKLESSKGSKEFKIGEKPPLKCFLCEGPHRARDCPKKAKLSALVKESEEREQEETKVSSLQLLSAIKAKVEMPENGRNGRMFVEAKAGDRVTKALVDCGASHNFLQVEEARRLRIHYKDERGWLKAREAKLKAKSISAIQLAKGMKKAQPTYVAAIKEEEDPLLGSVPEKVQKTDASDFALGGVLMQDEHPVAYESRKLNDAERRYTVQEKEMTAVVHCLRTWRHYLLGSKREGLEHDPQAKSLMELASQGKTRRFWLEDGVLMTKGNRTYIPKWQGLRREIIKECHDSKWAGHPGVRRTLALVERAYYWPHMRDDIELYVRTCLVCQQDKIEQAQPTGLLEPLPTPDKPWESISMDFITCLPKSEGCGNIMVVVDRFSKYGVFIPMPTKFSAEDAARMFFKHLVKYWGLPKTIVSDRDTRFTGRFWMELFKILGSELNFSTSFHPQTDGQTERVNALLELYLRHYVSANQKDWAKLLDIAQFSYNLQKSESTGASPFEIATGQQPMTPHTLAVGYTGPSPAAFKFAKGWHEKSDMARAYLAKATKKMKKWADTKRRHLEFEEGDLVMVKLLPHQTRRFAKLHKGLVRRYEGPFPVEKRIGKLVYRLVLPSHLEMHPVFHVSLLKPYHKDMEDLSRGETRRAPTAITEVPERDVEEILAHRVVPRRGSHSSYVEYLVKWKGAPDSEASWEHELTLWNFKDLIEAYKQEATRTSPD
ncbi:Transposon Tf2-2 polyprotein [Senna tora]|uniref:Transposon Tf2-2 polyprotein n=1 Tax=Senna tora TaxID=362788 RepID=A0A834SQZ9_9FABA|nr:Transposon Tf2-2 polyprotein [Senna tora]